MVTAGITCTTVSYLNPKADTSTITKGEGKTGEALEAVLDLVESDAGEEVELLLLENVVGLMRNDQHLELVAKVEEKGFLCLWAVLNAKDWGLPQERVRIYFACIRQTKHKHFMSRDYYFHMFRESIDLMKGSLPEIPFDDILLPDNHPVVKKLLDDAMAIPADEAIKNHHQMVLNAVRKEPSMGSDGQPNPKKAKTGIQWTLKHATRWASAMELGSGDEPDDQRVTVGSLKSFKNFPALRALTMRELDVIMTRCPHLPEPNPRLIDVSQSVDRDDSPALEVPQKIDCAKTITPKGIVMHTGKVRPLVGIEKMHCQGGAGLA